MRAQEVFCLSLVYLFSQDKGLSFQYHDSKHFEGSSTILWIKPNLSFGVCKKVTANSPDGARYLLTLLTTLT